MPPDYEQCVFYAYQRCTHGNRRVNDYSAKYLKLVKRNQLPESENQSKALQAEVRNFLIEIVSCFDSMVKCCARNIYRKRNEPSHNTIKNMYHNF